MSGCGRVINITGLVRPNGGQRIRIALVITIKSHCEFSNQNKDTHVRLYVGSDSAK